MAKSRQRSSAKPGRGSGARMRAAEPSPRLRERLDQARLLGDPRVRALWPRLERRQQQLVLDPSSATGHRYPLTSGEVARLTGMSERQVRYWADRGLLAHWRQGRQRLFEAVGVINAFAITNASQHELQFYRGVMEEPVDRLAAKLGILSGLLAQRLEGIDTDAADQLTAPLGDLTHR